MRRDQDRSTGFSGVLIHHRKNGGLIFWIEVRGWLIGNNRGRTQRQRLNRKHTLSLSTAQLVWVCAQKKLFAKTGSREKASRFFAGAGELGHLIRGAKERRQAGQPFLRDISRDSVYSGNPADTRASWE
jgi:hypothetical protein